MAISRIFSLGENSFDSFLYTLDIPNTWFFLVWIAQNLIGLYDQENAGVAFACHVGGFLCGFVLAKMLPIRSLDDYVQSST